MMRDWGSVSCIAFCRWAELVLYSLLALPGGPLLTGFFGLANPLKPAPPPLEFLWKILLRSILAVVDLLPRPVGPLR